MILLGLMVELSRRVRRDATEKLTRQMLQRLTVVMNQYQDQHGRLPAVTPLLSGDASPGESELATAARRNSADLLIALRLPVNDPVFGPQMVKTADGLVVLADPWGTPVVFMAQQNPLIGMAPGDRFFFFSAGPDHQLHSREDNLYSYEETSSQSP